MQQNVSLRLPHPSESAAKYVSTSSPTFRKCSKIRLYIFPNLQKVQQNTSLHLPQPSESAAKYISTSSQTFRKCSKIRLYIFPNLQKVAILSEGWGEESGDSASLAVCRPSKLSFSYLLLSDVVLLMCPTSLGLTTVFLNLSSRVQTTVAAWKPA